MKNSNNIVDISNDLNQEIKNLIFSVSDANSGIQKRRHCEIKVKYLLHRLVDELNISQVIPDYFLQIKFANSYNVYHKDPAVSLANFMLSEV